MWPWDLPQKFLPLSLASFRILLHPAFYSLFSFTSVPKLVLFSLPEIPFLFLKLPVNSYSSFKTLLKGHLSCEIISELQERIHYFHYLSFFFLKNFY